MMTHHEIIQRKIFSFDAIKRQAYTWRTFQKRIIFTNGCFDILHQGHVDYLSKARDLGNILVVGVNADASVKRMNKSPERPINNELTRSFIIASLCVADAVVLFNEDTPYELIELIQPHVLVKGSDYDANETNHQSKKYIVGSDIVKSNGGEVFTIGLTEGFSTTGLIQKINSGK